MKSALRLVVCNVNRANLDDAEASVQLAQSPTRSLAGLCSALETIWYAASFHRQMDASSSNQPLPQMTIEA